MKKTILLFSILTISYFGWGQQGNKKDTTGITPTNGIVDVQSVWNKYIDSVVSKLSIKQFQDWLFENATVKQYNDGKFVDFYQSYLNYRYNIWIAEWNDKHKTKKP